MNYKNGHVCDYAYKSEILKNDELLKLQRDIKRCLFVGHDIVVDPKAGEILDYETAKGLDMLYCNDSDFIEASKINQSHYQRSSRLRKRIQKYLTMGNCVFLTLTFTDETLSKTSQETRKRYVTRYLKSQSEHYIANIDFGAENGREHYHAVVCADSIDYQSWHHLGAVKGERIRTSSLSSVRLGKYISKLTNHAIKETTKRNAIIYSRD